MNPVRNYHSHFTHMETKVQSKNKPRVTVLVSVRTRIELSADSKPGRTSKVNYKKLFGRKGKEENEHVLSGNFCQPLKESLYVTVSFALQTQPSKVMLLAPFSMWETSLKIIALITDENGIGTHSIILQRTYFHNPQESIQ